MNITVKKQAVPGLKNLRGIIWDLDNTLYRFEDDFEQACHIAAARAALKGGVAMTYEEAHAISLQSYDRYGHSYRLFIEQHGLTMTQLHYDFHTFIDEKLINRSLELAALFSASRHGHVLVTHASAEWAARALSHIGLKKYFPDDRIIAAEAVDFARKSESRIPFERALSTLDLPADQVAVVEDIAENLRIPRAMGMTTALVHYGRPPQPLPEFIDLSCNNAAEFMALLAA